MPERDGTTADASSTEITSPQLAVLQGLLGDDLGSMRAVGRGGNARFLVPDDRRLAAAACTAHNGLRLRRRQAERVAAAAVLRVGLGNLLGTPLPAGSTRVVDERGVSLREHLSSRCGTEVQLAVGLGAFDAWWTPVLQLLDPVGRSAGFAKVGWNEVTTSMVRREHELLTAVGPRVRSTIVPQVIDLFEFSDSVVLLTAPLPARSTRLAPTELPDVPGDICDVGGAQIVPILESDWWRRRATAARAVSDSAASEALTHDLTAAEQRLSGRRARFGVVHGDWVPWNLARSPDGRLVVWDWEHGSLSGPLGVDVVHGHYQIERLVNGADDVDAFERAHGSADSVDSMVHAVMVMARRIDASVLDTRPVEHDPEFLAAAGALSRAVEQ